MNILSVVNEDELINKKERGNLNGYFLCKIDLIVSNDLLRIIEIIHNHIYANEGLATNEVLNELVKVLMIKFIDEQKKEDEILDFYITEDESIELHKNSGSLFVSRINNLYKKVMERYPDLSNIQDELKLSPSVLAFTVAQLQRYNLFDMDNDIKGLLFQKVINSGQKGERGQFFTPHPIVSFMVNFIRPEINQKVLDPACGTGGFLRQVIAYMRNKFDQEHDIDSYIKNKIFGIEINPNISRIANLRFIFEGSDATNVMCYNTLSKYIKDENKADRKSIVPFEMNAYDLILTNPPFGTQGKITDKKILASFELGHKWTINKTSTLQSGQAPDILFIERCIELLKEGGKLGIVLPDGDLENPSLKYVRTYILDKCKLIAVIKLPDQAFVPFGTGVKASILFLEKRKKKEAFEKTAVFFARINKLGYFYNKNANTSYKKGSHGDILLNSNGEPIIAEDYTDILKQYERFTTQGEIETSENCFLINSDDINGRFDFEFYEPKYMTNNQFLKEKSSVILKNVAKILKGKASILKQKNKVVRYIEISDVNPSMSEIISCSELAVHELPSRATFEVRTGDIITSVAGNAIGTSRHASAIVTEEYDKCICTNGFRVIKPFAVDPYYLIYFLKSEYFLNQILRLRTGAAIPSILEEDFNNLLVLLPNENIMSEIVNKVKLSFDLRAQARKLLNEDFSSLLRFQK